MEGFIVFDYAKQYPRALAELATWLSEGKIKRKETILTGGLKQCEYALRDLFNGANTGKLLLFFFGLSQSGGLRFRLLLPPTHPFCPNVKLIKFSPVGGS